MTHGDGVPDPVHLASLLPPERLGFRVLDRLRIESRDPHICQMVSNAFEQLLNLYVLQLGQFRFLSTR